MLYEVITRTQSPGNDLFRNDGVCHISGTQTPVGFTGNHSLHGGTLVAHRRRGFLYHRSLVLFTPQSEVHAFCFSPLYFAGKCMPHLSYFRITSYNVCYTKLLRMSMGHTVAVKAIEGVKAALSMTIPTGTGIHRRMVYIELKDGYKYEEVAAAIKSDAYFVNDETHVIQVPCVDELLDMGHGVNLTRKGVSGKTQNQLFEFNMKINNPALTAQVLICVARASMKQQPGCYTLIEVPVIDLLEGDREDLIAHLV